VLSIELPVLGALVVSGVTIVLVLTRVVGWSARATIEDLDAARRQLSLDAPDEQAGDGVLADDRRSALLELSDGRAAVVFVVGDRLVSRVLAPGFVRRVTTRVDGLRIGLRDFGTPRVDVRLADESITARWAARCGG
jgi:hypothetical protein